MGGIRKQKKKYKKPRKVWDKKRIEEEHNLKKTYGLKNMKELWRLKGLLRKKRKIASELLAMELEERIERQKELINSLTKYNILSKGATIDDILSLEIEAFLERRLQTIVLRKNMSKTIKQARQLITHGHISINKQKNTNPGYLVKAEEENKTGYYNDNIKEKILVTLKKEKPKEKKVEKKTEIKTEKVEATKAQPEIKVKK